MPSKVHFISASRSDYFIDSCSVVYSNVDQFPNKKNESISTLDELKPHIVCLTEILPKRKKDRPDDQSIHDDIKNEYYIPGYEIFSNDNPKRGVAIYTKPQLNAVKYLPLCNSDFDESLWINFTSKTNENILLGCIYHSPNSSKDNTDKLFELLQRKELSKFDKICITGDFN